MKSSIISVALPCLLSFSLVAETVKDREGAVRQDKAKMESNSRWIYQSVDEGFNAASLTGKPVMVILRCVPCMGCMGIDTAVLLENDDLKPLMDQFVRVRIINANALDLSLFQFDYDLSFTAMFFAPDKTILGRFGSWSHQKDAQKNSVETFKQALEKALEVHKNFNELKPSLVAKQSKPSRFKNPTEMPALKGKFQSKLDWNGKVVKSCVHCHQIGDSIRFTYREANQAVPLNWIYPFPDMEVTGAALAEDDALKLASVAKGSPADKAGLQPGDIITHLDGTPMISSADISWILHNLPDRATVSVGLLRDGSPVATKLALPGNWRTLSNIERRGGSWPMRAMAFGGMKLEELPDDEKKALGIPAGKMALIAKHVGQYGNHALAKKEGWMKGDVLVSVSGSDRALSESQLIGAMITRYKPGQKVPCEIVRKNRRMKLRIPVQ